MEPLTIPNPHEQFKSMTKSFRIFWSCIESTLFVKLQYIYLFTQSFENKCILIVFKTLMKSLTCTFAHCNEQTLDFIFPWNEYHVLTISCISILGLNIHHLLGDGKFQLNKFKVVMKISPTWFNNHLKLWRFQDNSILLFFMPMYFKYINIHASW
jgi:hypothetical protein